MWLESSGTRDLKPAKKKELSNYSQYVEKKILNTRIDEIHGQVAGIWSTSLSTQRITANDEAATDPYKIIFENGSAFFDAFICSWSRGCR